MINRQITIEGLLFDGNTSKSVDATLSVNQGGLITLEADGKRQSPVISNISARLGSSARYIDIENLGRFETRDNDKVDLLSEILFANNKSTILHTLESNLLLIIIAVIVTIGFTGATIKWGIPTLADYIVEVMPDKTNDLIGDAITEKIEDRWFNVSTLEQARQNELHDKFNQVLKKLGSENKGYVFKLKDAQNSVGANALAFPSGLIIMTDQLVKLADNDDQLMGIMAHEIGHLDAEHSLRQIVRGSIITFLVAFISGDISGASSTLITAPVALLELSYSREFETEADGYALRYFDCNIEGINSMANFFGKLENAYRFDSSSDSSEPTQENSNEFPEKDVNGSEINNSNDQVTEDILAEEEPGFDSDFLSTHPGSGKRKAFFNEHIKSHCNHQLSEPHAH